VASQATSFHWHRSHGEPSAHRIRHHARPSGNRKFEWKELGSGFTSACDKLAHLFDSSQCNYSGFAGHVISLAPFARRAVSEGRCGCPASGAAEVIPHRRYADALPAAHRLQASVGRTTVCCSVDANNAVLGATRRYRHRAGRLIKKRKICYGLRTQRRCLNW
jgi:hypothetical protein